MTPEQQAAMTPEQQAAMKLQQVRSEVLLGAAHGLRVPAWLRKTRGEYRWPVSIAMTLLVFLQLGTRGDLVLPPRYLLPALELALFGILAVGNPKRISRETTALRIASFGLLGAAATGTAWSAGRLVYQLANGHFGDKPIPLLANGGAIWLMNVIVFALAYWDFDRGGPAARANARKPHPDFLFTQMTVPELTSRDWEPAFLDYLYLSFTNATAFSPTDTLPLTRWAKLTMMCQSAISLVTVALVVARAVNIFT
jgi:hypothetical protein